MARPDRISQASWMIMPASIAATMPIDLSLAISTGWPHRGR